MTPFCNECNKCNKILDSIYHMPLKVPIKSHFLRENDYSLPLCSQCYYWRHYVVLLNMQATSGLSSLVYDLISLLDVTSWFKNIKRYFCRYLFRLYLQWNINKTLMGKTCPLAQLSTVSLTFTQVHIRSRSFNLYISVQLMCNYRGPVQRISN